MTLEELKVIITAETSGLRNELNSLQAQLTKTQNKVSKSTSNMSSSFKKMTKAISFTAVIYGLTKLTKAAVNAASDLEEVQNVVDVAFGSMADEVNAFAETALTSFGLSSLQAKQFASNFMAMSNSMGIGAEDGKNMSLQLTALAGDLASFYNVSQEVADTALKSVFTGETETLKKFGITMTEANLSAFALSQGITKSYSAMSQAEKVALRYNYVLSTTAQVQGDFARTSDSWANQVRILKQQWIELLAILGKGVEKILKPVVKVLNTMLSSLIAVGNSIAKVFGGKITNKTETQVKDTADSAGSLDGNIQDATQSAKELSRTIAGFDELNILTENKTENTDTSTTTNLNIAEFKLDDSEVDGQLTDAQSKIEKFLTDVKKQFEAWKITLPELKLNFDKEAAVADLQSIGENLLSTFGNIGDFVIRIGIEVANDLDIGQLANDVLGLFKSFTGLASSITGAVLPALEAFYKVGLSPLVEAIGEVASAILQWTSGQLDDWAAWFDKNKTDIVEFATNLGKVVEPLSTIIGELLKVAWSVLSTALELASTALQKLAEAILTLDETKLAAIVYSLLTLAGIKFGADAALGIQTFFKALNIDCAGGLLEKLSYLEGYVTGDGKLTMAFTTFGNKVKDIFTMIAETSVGSAMIAEWTSYGEAVAATGTKFNVLEGGARAALSGISALWTAFISNPIAIIIAAVAALAAGFIYLWNTNEEFRESMTKLYNDVIKPLFGELAEKLSSLWNDSLKPLWEESIKPLFDKIGEKAGELFKQLKQLWDTILAPLLEIIIKVVGVVVTTVLDVVITAVENIINLIQDFILVLKGVIDFLVGVFTGDWETAWNGLKEIFEGIINGIVDTFTGAIDTIVSAVQTAVDAINTLFGSTNQKTSISGVQTSTVSYSYGMPKLASGGVITSPTVAMMGEYAGASTNPEIVAPQSLLKQVFENSNSGVMNAIYSIGNQISKSVEEKNTDIYMDTAKVTRRITKEQTAQKKQMGTSLVLI